MLQTFESLLLARREGLRQRTQDEFHYLLRCPECGALSVASVAVVGSPVASEEYREPAALARVVEDVLRDRSEGGLSCVQGHGLPPDAAEVAWACSFAAGAGRDLQVETKLTRGRAIVRRYTLLSPASEREDFGPEPSASFLDRVFEKPTWAHHLRWALGHESSGDRDRALEAIRRAVEEAPGVPEVHFAHGNILAGLGKLEESVDAYVAALRADADFPAVPEVRFNLGNVYFRLGLAEEAVAEWEEAVRRNPENPEARFNLGRGYQAMGEKQRAVREFESYLELRPDADDRASVQALIRDLGNGKNGSDGKKK
ncbi:MAG: tetratricopeptide repeat protein [Planctomycetales bacterium]|nr:tetratricopeptide repeat protein [Planctomycetales bacterium]